ncbi:MAG: HutD family protein [Burkholderiales bacterium]|nr:HutD family protein [Burkholderiales bacterium]
MAATAPEPWRNGGGTTRVLLTWPGGPGTAAPWQLRISVAEIAADGPFSPFPGVERWFAVVAGAGVQLGLPGGVATLRAGDDPLHFDGEAAPGCTLLAGPTQDLNLMVRHDAGQAGMAPARPGATLPAGLLWRGLYAADAATLEPGGGADGAQQLPAGTLLWSDAADDQATPWTLRDAQRAWWLWVQAP